MGRYFGLDAHGKLHLRSDRAESTEAVPRCGSDQCSWQRSVSRASNTDQMSGANTVHKGTRHARPGARLKSSRSLDKRQATHP